MAQTTQTEARIGAENSRPYLSIVATARNDDHGGNLLSRMQIFVNALIAQVKRHGVPTELVVVDWNPPEGKPPLMEALRFPADLGPCSIRMIEVPREVHERYKHSEALPLYQMIAKNVGIRRADGEFILATNIDIIFSDEIFEFFAQRRLEPGKMYRLDRHDVTEGVPVNASIDEQLAYCKTNLLRINAREGSFRLTPDGLRMLEDDDIAEQGSGIFFGSGWFPIERDGRQRYRWVDTQAELILQPPAAGVRELIFEGEPGPGVGYKAFWLQLLDASQTVRAEVEVPGRARIRLQLPDARGQRQHYRLRVLGGGLRVQHDPRDPRILNFRVFRCYWEERKDEPAEETHPPAAELEVEEFGAGMRLSTFWRRVIELVQRYSRAESPLRIGLPLPASWMRRLDVRVEGNLLSFSLHPGGVRVRLRRLRNRLWQTLGTLKEEGTAILRWLRSLRRRPDIVLGADLFWDAGWYPQEDVRGDRFRWAQQQAKWIVRIPEAPAMCLRALIEPGPSIGFEPFHLRVRDANGRTVATAVVERRKWVELPLPWYPGRTQVFTLECAGGGPPKAPRGDSRDLYFRVLDYHWSRPAPETSSGTGWAQAAMEGNREAGPLDAGVVFGYGWQGTKKQRSGPWFKWAVDGAEMIVAVPDRGEKILHLDIEPAAGAKSLDIFVSVSDSQSPSRFRLQERQVITLPMAAWEATNQLIRFEAAPRSGTHQGDGKHLFRLFQAGFQGLRDDILTWNPAPEETQTAEKSDSAPAETLPRDEILPAAPPAGAPATIAPAAITSPPFTGAEVAGAMHLHTNACGDFTLLAREHWFDLRGYPEFDLFSMNLDSVFCYAAHHGGAQEVILEDPIRIYHIEHATGSGFTPEGQEKLFRRVAAKGLSWLDYHDVVGWAVQMRRLQSPMIFNLQDWGLAKFDLAERTLRSHRQTASP